MITHQGGHFGYLTVDHRDSPGLSQEFVEAAARAGKPILNAPEGKVIERDTFMCGHCNRPVIKSPRRPVRNICRVCMEPICHEAGCNIGCLPMSKVLEIGYAQAHRDPTKVADAVAYLRRSILGA